jgi:hypothetical protein
VTDSQPSLTKRPKKRRKNKEEVLESYIPKGIEEILILSVSFVAVFLLPFFFLIFFFSSSSDFGFFSSFSVFLLLPRSL